MQENSGISFLSVTLKKIQKCTYSSQYIYVITAGISVISAPSHQRVAQWHLSSRSHKKGAAGNLVMWLCVSRHTAFITLDSPVYLLPWPMRTTCSMRVSPFRSGCIACVLLPWEPDGMHAHLLMMSLTSHMISEIHCDLLKRMPGKQIALWVIFLTFQPTTNVLEVTVLKYR